MTSQTQVGADRTAPYLPGLDGLRALSVLVVVAFHSGVIEGGWIGVDVFFGISGFLITGLMVAEHNRNGNVALGAFWMRRLRRLVPALIVLLGLVAALVQFNQVEVTARNIWGALTYSTNWVHIFGGTSYWDQFATPDPLRHLWSLAIEEQFYVVWPIVAWYVLKRREKIVKLNCFGRRFGKAASDAHPEELRGLEAAMRAARLVDDQIAVVERLHAEELEVHVGHRVEGVRELGEVVAAQVGREAADLDAALDVGGELGAVEFAELGDAVAHDAPTEDFLVDVGEEDAAGEFREVGVLFDEGLGVEDDGAVEFFLGHFREEGPAEFGFDDIAGEAEVEADPVAVASLDVDEAGPQYIANNEPLNKDIPMIET